MKTTQSYRNFQYLVNFIQAVSSISSISTFMPKWTASVLSSAFICINSPKDFQLKRKDIILGKGERENEKTIERNKC